MKTKIIASSLAGLAILGGTVGFALSDAGSAGAATKPAAATAPATVRGFLKAHRHALRHAGLDAAAKVLGMTPDALRAELKSGKSVAEVAQSKNISVADVENALVKDADTKIESWVSAGKLTQDKATKIEAKVPAAVDKAVNHVFGQK